MSCRHVLTNYVHPVFVEHRDLKGKEWVLGSNGEVLAVEHPNPDKLLPTQPSPPVHIHDSSGSDIHGTVVGGSSATRRRSLAKSKPAAAIADSSDSTTNATKQQRMKGRHKSSTLTATSATTYFVLDPVVQPSYIETMQLSSGVALKQNDAVKQGPELQADPQHMSRAEFLLRTRQWHDASASADMRSVVSGSVFSTATAAVGTTGGAGDSNSSIAAAGLTPRSTETASQQQQSAAVVLPSTRVSNRTSDPMAGAVHTTTSTTAAATGSNGIDTSGADYDPHWQLYKSPEFSNPTRAGPAPLARLPHKPPTTATAASTAASAHYYDDDGAVSVSASAAAASVRTSKSPSPPRRDRGGAAGMPPTREARHLPQPPVGYTMGHGLHTPAGGSVVSALSVGSEVLSPQALMKDRSSGAKGGSSGTKGRGVVHKRKSDATIQALLLR
jgi:hypothetical protein